MRRYGYLGLGLEVLNMRRFARVESSSQLGNSGIPQRLRECTGRQRLAARETGIRSTRTIITRSFAGGEVRILANAIESALYICWFASELVSEATGSPRGLAAWTANE